MTGAERLMAEITRALPDIKSGSLVVFGDSFGRPLDNIHTVVGAEADPEDCAVIHFDENETLRVWNPDGIHVSQVEFRVDRASRVRWEWFCYGRPQTPDNLFFEEHRAFADRVEAASNVDWYTPTFAPSLAMAAVQLA